MEQHVTIKLKSKEDFDSLLQVINSTPNKEVSLDAATLKIECYLDKFLLSMAQLYLKAEIIYHNGKH
jgi:hypothetical protein